MRNVVPEPVTVDELVVAVMFPVFADGVQVRASFQSPVFLDETAAAIV